MTELKQHLKMCLVRKHGSEVSLANLSAYLREIKSFDFELRDLRNIIEEMGFDMYLDEKRLWYIKNAFRLHKKQIDKKFLPASNKESEGNRIYKQYNRRKKRKAIHCDKPIYREGDKPFSFLPVEKLGWEEARDIAIAQIRDLRAKHQNPKKNARKTKNA